MSVLSIDLSPLYLSCSRFFPHYQFVPFLFVLFSGLFSLSTSPLCICPVLGFVLSIDLSPLFLSCSLLCTLYVLVSSVYNLGIVNFIVLSRLYLSCFHVCPLYRLVPFVNLLFSGLYRLVPFVFVLILYLSALSTSSLCIFPVLRFVRYIYW